MSTAAQIVDPAETTSRPVIYPETDGLPMADNTKQYEWIVRLKGGLEAVAPEAFVAGNIFWYYTVNHPEQVVSPDILAAYGRPRGDRRSYLQWEEGGVAPQIVIEVWSPSNRWPERARKLLLYSSLGVEEFITYDPDENLFAAFVRTPGGGLSEVAVPAGGWVSPRSGVRFVPGEETLEVYGPGGERFRYFAELVADLAAGKEALAKAEEERVKAEEERARAEEERARAEEERAKAEEERAKAIERAAALEARLRALGVEPG